MPKDKCAYYDHPLIFRDKPVGDFYLPGCTVLDLHTGNLYQMPSDIDSEHLCWIDNAKISENSLLDAGNKALRLIRQAAWLSPPDQKCTHCLDTGRDIRNENGICQNLGCKYCNPFAPELKIASSESGGRRKRR